MKEVGQWTLLFSLSSSGRIPILMPARMVHTWKLKDPQCLTADICEARCIYLTLIWLKCPPWNFEEVSPEPLGNKTQTGRSRRFAPLQMAEYAPVWIEQITLQQPRRSLQQPPDSQSFLRSPLWFAVLAALDSCYSLDKKRGNLNRERLNMVNKKNITTFIWRSLGIFIFKVNQLNFGGAITFSRTATQLWQHNCMSDLLAKCLFGWIKKRCTFLHAYHHHELISLGVPV